MLKFLDYSVASPIPDPGCIISLGSQYLLTIRAKFSKICISLKDLRFFAAGYIPDTDGLIITKRNQVLTVRAEYPGAGGYIGNIGRPAQSFDQVTGGSVPDPHPAIVTARN